MFEEIRRHQELQKANILRGFGINPESDESLEFAKGEIEYDELQKAVYADTAENRKLGRVGQEYHQAKGKKEGEQPKSKKETSSSSKQEGVYEFEGLEKTFKNYGMSLDKPRTGWAVRNEDGTVSFYLTGARKPEKWEDIHKRGEGGRGPKKGWSYDVGEFTKLPSSSFPELTYDSKPIKIKIKPKSSK